MREAPDGARLIRFGARGRWAEQALRDAQDALDDVGRAELSVYCASPDEGETDDQTLARICASSSRRGAKWFRAGQVAVFRSADLAPVQDEDEQDKLHFNVDLGSADPPSVERFLNCLEPEERKNPVWVRH